MNRREFLAGTTAFAAGATLSGPHSAFAQQKRRAPQGKGLPKPAAALPASPIPRAQAIAAWKTRIEEILRRGSLPIIDVQATYVPQATNVAFLIEQMNRLDVAQIVFATATLPNSSASLDLQRRYPQHVVPSTSSGEFPRWWKGPVQFVSALTGEVQSGAYYMMGEHEFRHYPSPEQAAEGRTGRDIAIDIAGPAGEALFSLSERTGVAFQIHYEIEDRLLPAIETMLSRYSKAKVIWCHVGMVRYPKRNTKYGPAYVASLIERYPGLHFDLATPQAANIYKPSGARDGTLYDFPSGSLNANWKAVLQKYPDRFLCASDYRPAVEKFFPNQIGFQRKLLSQIDRDARRLLAFGNAWRLITGKSWA